MTDHISTVHVYNFLRSWNDPRVKLEYKDDLAKNVELEPHNLFGFRLLPLKIQSNIFNGRKYVKLKISWNFKSQKHIPHIQNPCNNEWIVLISH